VWALARAGEQPERIAAKFKIDVEEVESLIKRFEAARVMVSADIVDMAVNSEVMIAADGVGADIRDARRAMRFTGAYDSDGNPVYDRDWATTLDAVDALGGLIGQVRPKSGGPAINIGINNQPGNGNGAATVKTFEQRVREKRGVLADGDVKFLSDGQNNEINEIMDGDVIDDEDDDDAELEDDTMMDGTSAAEIEEMDGVKD
jgi:hypothetical protein